MSALKTQHEGHLLQARVLWFCELPQSHLSRLSARSALLGMWQHSITAMGNTMDCTVDVT